MLKVNVLEERVLVKVESESKVRKSGIILPDSVQKAGKKEATLGLLVQVGPDVQGSTKELLVLNQFVLFNKWVGVPVSIDDEEYLILDASDVLGVFNGNVQ